MNPSDPRRRPPPTPEKAELEARSWTAAFRGASEEGDDRPTDEDEKRVTPTKKRRPAEG